MNLAGKIPSLERISPALNNGGGNIPSKRICLYIPEENQKDVDWAKKEFPKKAVNQLLFDALHEQRTRIETGRTDAAAKTMTAEQKMTGKDYYKSIFGHLGTDYSSDTDLVIIVGRENIRGVIQRLFDTVSTGQPQYLDLCQELLKQEHPKLYRIWDTHTE